MEFEAKLIRAEAAALKCLEYKKNGYTPDIIISHPGWGESLLIKEVWPEVKLLSYFEFYYNTINSDIDFPDSDEYDDEKRSFNLRTGFLQQKDLLEPMEHVFTTSSMRWFKKFDFGKK